MLTLDFHNGQRYTIDISGEKALRFMDTLTDFEEGAVMFGRTPPTAASPKGGTMAFHPIDVMVVSSDEPPVDQEFIDADGGEL